MADVIILNFAESEYPVLERFRIAESQALSWSPDKRDSKGIIELVKRVEPELSSLPLSPIDRPIEVRSLSDDASLEDYIKDFVEQGIGPVLTPKCIVFNFMPVHLSPTLVDKIANGMRLAALSPSCRLLFLTRNADWFKQSVSFSRLVKNSHLGTIVVDLRGICIKYSTAGEPASSEIPRSYFQKILAFKGNTFYNSLIFGTNSFIGHFLLENSHVRTHYDLSEFIRRDNVAEHVFRLIEDLLDNYQQITILGVGLESSVITGMAYQLQTRLSGRVCDFEYPCDYTLQPARARWERQSDCILLLTDIVNSGSSLEAMVSSIVNDSPSDLQILIFSLIRMCNSPISIQGVPIKCAIMIKRPYYPNDPEDCPLCSIGQPEVRVNEIRDFSKVADSQLTPFDFWEIVQDSKALVRRRGDAQGRILTYRIDTLPIGRRYGNWLINVIRSKYDQRWSNRIVPDVILTVAEETGFAFADLVSRALGVKRIEGVTRDELSRTTPSGGPASNVLDDGPERILIVDDGMNYGNTMAALIDFSRAATRNPMGAIVFDNRLDKVRVDQLQARMAGSPIIALYTWPSSPVEENEDA